MINLFGRYLLSALLVVAVVMGCSDNPVDSTPSDTNDDPPSPPVDGAQLTIDEPEFVFGYAPQHSKVSHVFWLKSTGDDTLRILSVRPG